MPTLDRQDSVFVLNPGDGENCLQICLHPDWIASANAMPDEVENADAPHALLTAATELTVRPGT
ncbi:hypothetical protein [Streptomyces sp. NPDC019507]|uniref:hypothetical protein n=1 Tax=Streptomyces sp. NPDC019507 TaxID=3154689 RepID=UPI0033E3E7A1